MEHVGGKILEHLDKNKDGKVSEEEFVSQARERFKRADSNKDGSIDKSDLKSLFSHGHHRSGAKPAGKPGKKPAGKKPASKKSDKK